MREGIQKAVVAAIGGAVSLIALWFPGVEDVVTPEIVASIAAIVTAVLVYLVPNSKGEGDA